MNRKTTAFAGSLVALFGLAACATGSGSNASTTGAGPAPTDQPITLTVMSTTVVGDPEMTVEKKIAADFMAAHPNITVEFVGVNYNDYATKLTTVATSHSVPDVFADGPELSAKVESFGIAADLTPLLGEDFIAGFDPNVIKESYVDDKLAYAPYYTIPMSLIYRSDLFEAAGMEPPTTWDEFVADAQKLTTDNQWGFAMVGTADGSGGSRFVPAMRTFGAQELAQGDDGTWSSGIDSEGGIAALQLWGDLVNKYKVVPPGALTTKYPDAVNEMASGQAAMMISGTNGIGAILAQAPDLEGKLATAPLPAAPGSKPVTVLGQLGWAISNTSKNQAAAAEYIKFFLSQENQIAWTKATGRLAVRTDALESPELSIPQYAGATEAMQYAVQLPQVPYYSNVQLDCAKAFQAVISGTSAEQAAKDAQAAINKEVADNG
jgi:ABC-type glycerol-3-phosphate transport system substrate-binding protein